MYPKETNRQQLFDTAWINLNSFTAQRLKMQDESRHLMWMMDVKQFSSDAHVVFLEFVFGVMSPLLSAWLMPSAEWTESEQDVASSSCYLLHKHTARPLLSLWLRGLHHWLFHLQTHWDTMTGLTGQ